MDILHDESQKFIKDLLKESERINIEIEDLISHGVSIIRKAEKINGYPSPHIPEKFKSKIPFKITVDSIYDLCISAGYFHFWMHSTKKIDDVPFLIAANRYLGAAIGGDSGVFLMESDRKQKLKISASEGGKSKNKLTAELKAWALQQIKNLKMDDPQAADYLSARIPAHLADASKHPRQLIYRALLARHQAK